MEEFSLEDNGYFVNTSVQYSDDPFKVLDQPLPPKSEIKVDQYSDISDDDFQIPCSQKRLPSRSV